MKNLDEIKEALLFSNVPSFLLKKVTQSEACFDIKSKKTVKEIEKLLYKLIREYNKSEDKDVDIVASIYALVGALYLTREFDFRKFDTEKTSSVYWLNEVITNILKEDEAVQVIEINLDNQIKQESALEIQVSYSTN